MRRPPLPSLLLLWSSAFVTLAPLVVACSGNDGAPPPEPSPDASAAEAGAPAPEASTPDAAPTPFDAASDTNDLDDAAPAADAADVDAVADAADATPPATGVIPTHCVDLSGTYEINDDNLTLTRPDCGSLTWARAAAYDGTPAWTHLYTTDGLTRAVTDEHGTPILEEAHVDDTTMYVHRVTVSTDASTDQTVHWSTHPCNLLNPDGVYLTRETMDSTGTQTACEFWYYDACAIGMQECSVDPTTRCETNIDSDPNNCGGCGVVCGGANITNAQCANGACTLTCVAGFASCDGITSNGCETGITDTNNCGGCGAVCGSEGAASTTCVNGACAIVCDATHADCNGFAPDGCEVDTSDSGDACGGCGIDCGGAVCASSTCQGQGTTLATITGGLGEMQGDATHLYFYDATSSLYAIDKQQPGSPALIAAKVGYWSAAGDGSVYYLQDPAFGGPTTINRWVAATSTTSLVATESGSVLVTSLVADATGVVWTTSVVSTSPYAIAVRAWSPGDAAPHDLYDTTELGGIQLLTLVPDVIEWNEAAGADGGIVETVARIPRAGGAPQTIAALPTYTPFTQAFAIGSWLYLEESTTIDRVPLAGGTITQGWSPQNVYSVATDGTSLFIASSLGTRGESAYGPNQIVQLSDAGTPITPGLAFALAATQNDVLFTIDATAVYLFDGAKNQIRRVAR